MSLLMWSEPIYERPSRILDPHFGLGLDPEDFVAPLIPRELLVRRRRPGNSSASHRGTGSTVSFDKDHFQANLDVQQFQPEEITVKVSDDNTVTVEGKHEEKQDEHGFISRHFVRKYVLPKEHDIQRLESRLSTDGVLTITAPKFGQENQGHREIPITQTGQPSKAVEQKKEDDKSPKLKL